VGQTSAQFNGIWQASTVSSWGRTFDADAGNELLDASVFVEEGTTYQDTAWVCTTNAPITPGTTPLTWVQFSGTGQIVAGAGLTKTGNSIDVGGTVNRILVNVDTVDIDSNYVGQPSISIVGTISSGFWGGTTIDVAHGGTGNVSPKNARESGLLASGYYSSATHGAGTSISIPQATHGLRAATGLIVQCQVDATGAVVIPDIVVATNGDVTVTFGVSQAANTIRTTIIG
jgi:hypothetical protein